MACGEPLPQHYTAAPVAEPFASTPVPPLGPQAAAPVIAAAVLPAPPSGPAPGSPELPSLGSAGHGDGKCKPCAFFHTAGCGNGVCCKFCHLCDSGEKKRRRKEKMELQRSARKIKQAGNVSSPSKSSADEDPL